MSSASDSGGFEIFRSRIANVARMCKLLPALKFSVIQRSGGIDRWCGVKLDIGLLADLQCVTAVDSRPINQCDRQSGGAGEAC